MAPRNKTKSEPLVSKKLCRRLMITNAERKDKKLREDKPHRKRRKREKISKINIHKSVKTTGAHKRSKYCTHKRSNKEAPKIRRKTDEFEPHFRCPYKREPKKCHWSTTAVKSIDLKSFSSGFETIFRGHHKGNSFTIYTICR